MTLTFLALADMAFDTTLPALFFTSLSFVSPPWVFALRPEKTEDLARLPLAMTLTFLAFMAFFMADPFMATLFMAAFMAAFFMGSAMSAGDRQVWTRKSQAVAGSC